MLKELRENKGLTQEELAKKLKISKKHLIKLESEPRLCDPRIDLILRISKEFKISPITIFDYFVEKIGIEDKKD